MSHTKFYGKAGLRTGISHSSELLQLFQNRAAIFTVLVEKIAGFVAFSQYVLLIMRLCWALFHASTTFFPPSLISCRWWQLPYYWVGIKLYDLVAGSQCLKSSYVLSKSKALELFPMLKKDKLVGAIVYYDGMLYFCLGGGLLIAVCPYIITRS